MAFVFNKCCGCIELRTGCLIIGYLNLIAEIIVIALCVVGMVAGGVVAAQGGEHNEAEIGAFAVVASILVLIFVLLFFIFTVVFLVGVHKNKRGHIKAYLIFTVIFTVLAIIGWFAGFANPNLVLVDIVRNLISILINIYFLLVVRSYYILLDDPSKRPAIYNTA